MFAMLIFVACFLSYTGQNQPQAIHTTAKTNQSAPNSQVPSPSIPQISALQSKSTPDREQDAPNPQSKPWLTHGELVMSILTGIYVLLTLVYVCISGSTLKAIKRGEENSSKQFIEEIAEVRKSADAAKDSANATQRIVATLKEGYAQQMRAYLAVGIGFAVYQVRLDNKKFEGKPLVINTGQTPALKVRHRSKAAILSIPLPNDFNYPLPDEDAGASMLGAQRTANISAIVEEFVSDADVADIKHGTGANGLYIWGIVSYEDVFGQTHTTKYCQGLTWLPNGEVFGYYIPGYNDAD
jgi:hypothetical protein